MAQWCKLYITFNLSYYSGERVEPQFGRFFFNPRFAVFWDYASLYQHPNPKKGIFRTQKEQNLFEQGLDGLGSFFSHAYVHRFQCKEFPPKYPEGYDLPTGAKYVPYDQRGWPLFESAMFQMRDKGQGVVEIGPSQNIHGHTVGLSQLHGTFVLPDDFEKRLSEAFFTNAKSDRPLVASLYRKQFEQFYASLRRLDVGNRKWGNSELIQLARILESPNKYMPNLRSIDLGQNNRFGFEGFEALAMALQSENVPTKLVDFWLGDHDEDDRSSHRRRRAAGISQFIFVTLLGAGVGVKFCRELNRAYLRAKNDKIYVSLCILVLNENTDIGDGGVQELCQSGGLVSNQLRHLILNNVNLGDRGCRALHDTIAANSNDCRLTRLHLTGNKRISKVGERYLKNIELLCPAISIRSDRFQSQAYIEYEQ